jgi:hypothetical protein
MESTGTFLNSIARRASNWYLGTEDRILKLFGIDLVARARAEIARRDIELGRQIAGGLSRRSFAIRRGRLLTRDDLEERKRAFAKHDFKG